MCPRSPLTTAMQRQLVVANNERPQLQHRRRRREKSTHRIDQQQQLLSSSTTSTQLLAEPKQTLQSHEHQKPLEKYNAPPIEELNFIVNHIKNHYSLPEEPLATSTAKTPTTTNQKKKKPYATTVEFDSLPLTSSDEHLLPTPPPPQPQLRRRLKMRNGNIRDTYKVSHNIIGTGAFGTVRSCHDRSTLQKYAVKSILKTQDVKNAQLLKNEIALVQRVHHTNVVGIIDVVQDLEYIHIVMEECKGGGKYDAGGALFYSLFFLFNIDDVLHKTCTHLSSPLQIYFIGLWILVWNWVKLGQVRYLVVC